MGTLSLDLQRSKAKGLWSQRLFYGYKSQYMGTYLLDGGLCSECFSSFILIYFSFLYLHQRKTLKAELQWQCQGTWQSSGWWEHKIYFHNVLFIDCLSLTCSPPSHTHISQNCSLHWFPFTAALIWIWNPPVVFFHELSSLLVENPHHSRLPWKRSRQNINFR